jgi:hypothetical protein
MRLDMQGADATIEEQAKQTVHSALRREARVNDDEVRFYSFRRAEKTLAHKICGKRG